MAFRAMLVALLLGAQLGMRTCASAYGRHWAAALHLAQNAHLAGAAANKTHLKSPNHP